MTYKTTSNIENDIDNINNIIIQYLNNNNIYKDISITVIYYINLFKTIIQNNNYSIFLIYINMIKSKFNAIIKNYLSNNNFNSNLNNEIKVNLFDNFNYQFLYLLDNKLNK